MSGFLAFPPVVTYSVAKFGVIAVTETLARELRAAGSPVEVSLFCPGEVATHAIENAMRAARASGYEPTPDELAAVEQAQAGLLGGGMDPDDIGEIVLDGIRSGRFWIFSHPGWLDGPVQARFTGDDRRREPRPLAHARAVAWERRPPRRPQATLRSRPAPVPGFPS